MPWFDRPEGFYTKSFDTYADKRPQAPDCLTVGPSEDDYANYVSDPNPEAEAYIESVEATRAAMRAERDAYPIGVEVKCLYCGGIIEHPEYTPGPEHNAHGVCIIEAGRQVDVAFHEEDHPFDTHPEWMDEGGSE